MTGAPNLEQVLVVTTRASSSAMSRRIWSAVLPPKHGVICVGDGSFDHDHVAARNDHRPPSRLGLAGEHHRHLPRRLQPRYPARPEAGLGA